MRQNFAEFGSILLAGCIASATIAAEDTKLLPYGHPDFVPTPERPIGFQGDGNGHFPGATLVSEFWDGRPEWGEVEYRVGEKKKQMEFRYADQVPKNTPVRVTSSHWIPLKNLTA